MGRSLRSLPSDLLHLNRCPFPAHCNSKVKNPCGGTAIRLDAFMNMKKMSGVLTLVIVLAINVVCTGQANAQVSGATLAGTVSDSSGAVIPNAEVSITNSATGVTRTVTSGSA